MKTILLILTALTFGGMMQKIKAQCTLANPAVKLNYSMVDGSNCRIGIDLYFDMVHNSGGKFIWVHIWPATSYPNWNYGDPPTLANGGLTGSIATVGFEHQQDHLQVQNSYPPDPLAPGFQWQSIAVSEDENGILPGSERYTIKNLVLTIPGGCNIPQMFTLDVWQSQAAHAQTIHCYTTDLDFYANDPRVSGLMFCQIPRRFAFNVQSINTTGSMSVDYKVYIDNGDGIFNQATDNTLVYSGSSVLSSANNYTFSSGQQGYPPYDGQKPEADKDLWIEVTSPTVPNAIYAHLVNLCAPLPVKLAAFTAQRKNDRVQLSWTTSTEVNNRGFHIMRQNGSNGWQVMGFVPSRAINGNNDISIQYTFTDINNLEGVTQYRLQQEDLDNKITYSDIRLVKGINQDGKLLVYPNPSMNGQLYVVLDNMGDQINIQLINMNGKLVKEWNDLGNGRLTIGNISSGMYTLRVWRRDTNEVMNVKVIISK